MTPESAQLGQELRALRTLAKLSQEDIAEAIGKRRSTVQRAESGEQWLSRAQVQAWITRTKPSDEVARRIVALTEAMHGGGSWSDVLAGEPVQHLQGIAARRDEDARLIRSWTPSMVPALAQIDVYAHALLAALDIAGETDIPAATAARMQRQRILYEGGRQFEFLLGEEALYRRPAAGVMAAQLARLEAVAALDVVELAILPLRVSAPPWPGFVYREPAGGGPPYVTTELPDSGPVRTEPGAVAKYVEAWTQLWGAAVSGDAALTLIREARQ